MSITSFLFRASRISADLRAASKGPVPFVKRQVRKPVYRKVNGGLFSLFRKVGL